MQSDIRHHTRKLYPGPITRGRLEAACRFRRGGQCLIRQRALTIEDCEPRTCWAEVRPIILKAEGKPLLDIYSDEELLDFIKNYDYKVISGYYGQGMSVGKAYVVFVNNSLASSVYAYTLFLLTLDDLPLYVNDSDGMGMAIVKWRLAVGK